VSELCFARRDKYPGPEGDLLIIPNRHVADYFSLSAAEKTAGTITSTNTESPKIGG
jgi:diadenosine tetraphosphate (Ap4A) HIT family hydrolase